MINIITKEVANFLKKPVVKRAVLNLIRVGVTNPEVRKGVGKYFESLKVKVDCSLKEGRFVVNFAKDKIYHIDDASNSTILQGPQTINNYTINIKIDVDELKKLETIISKIHSISENELEPLIKMMNENNSSTVNEKVENIKLVIEELIKDERYILSKATDYDMLHNALCGNV